MARRIVVVVKHVPNIHSARAFADGRTVRGAEDGSLNELDEHPVEEAVRILEGLDEAERAESEIVVITVGPAEAVDALRRAFQLGATTAIHVNDEALAGSDYAGTAKALAAAVRKVAADGPIDLVLAGMAALDGLGSVVPALLAAELGLPQLTNAGKLELDGATARVERVVDGATEVLEAPLPAVVSVNDHINRPRFPNFKLIMAARTKPVTTWTLADLGVDAAEVGEAGARTRVLSAEPRPERAPVEIHVDAGAGGEALVEFLVRRGLV
ncbi:electron transfer flavoprotein subunit beta/FixA family protein [Flavimobilis sp. GY10621]|uniref:Electron transfer flavoprotein subunit beta n=1 Tax=Flavimobilis rhizosphaerae TaxID=2775421 RepID=A0ABR9DNH5_9MICO|nr:electron transfer flavoprotein subunit beta/FixA family protein [Flavimobilis rhizosphaerae]MBD9698514.1 electron transfer flavoprotein subunit beta/FixA family protein [Flavimobilis rhizosphaerae]